MAHLTVLSGPTRGKVIELGSRPCRFGRDPNVEVPIDDSKASRVHAEITLKDNNFILRDLHSKNGTLVNGTLISAMSLKEGDLLQVGETRFAFAMQDLPPAHAPDRRDYDSMLAARLPEGVRPALGTAGMDRSGGGETFETLELNAPLTILGGQDEFGGPAAPSDKAPDDNDSTRMAGAKQKAPAPGQPPGWAVRSLRALYALARTAAEAGSSAELWRALSSGLQQALEADRVSPVLLDEKGAWQVAAQDMCAAGKAGIAAAAFSKIPVSRTIVDYALRTRRSVLTVPRTDARFGDAKSVGEQGISSALCVPIISHNEVLGLVYADRLGGVDFVREDQELVIATCLQAAPALAHLRRLEELLARKEQLLAELKSQHNLLGASPRMKEVAAFIERAAPSDSVILILGESGTGKELVARAIHYSSRRSDAPLIIVNCAALTETLIESELFGHTKGAYTGATADRPGRFEMAHGGTIFLDEIGELSNSCQTKLLRVLEQGELSRVGEGRVRKVDVRVLAATNREIEAEMKAGRFREDLFYRLNVLAVTLPPLRERGADIALLLQHYLRDAAVRSGRAKLEFSEDALAALQQYRWPGNVRELRNLTERLAVLHPREIIGLPDLPLEYRTGQEQGPRIAAASPAAESPPGAAPAAGAPEKLEDVEKAHILRVLQSCDGNKKETAEKLGIDRSTLYAKLRAYGIM
ncbi:MAG: sigma 54-interacting transcriptional regulator [Planctomycetota bacterium]